MFDLVSSVLSQVIGCEERLRSDPFCVGGNVKSVDRCMIVLTQAGADEFVLAPVDATSVGEPARTRGNRRRRLVVDGATMISSLTIKANLGNVDAIIRPLDLAPPTKRLMTCKEFSSIDKIFTSPGCHLASSRLLKVRTLTRYC